MGVGKDSANFFRKGVVGFIKNVFVLGLLILIGYFGYKFIAANYGTNPNAGYMFLGLLLGDFAFCIIVERFIEQVLLKEKK